jgi:ribose transport system ATP-binding protein
MESILLTLKGVSKAFPGVQALNNVDFDLRRGEVHALVGENGAGKSTLMKILAGVYEKDAGEIVLDGQPIEVRNVHHARQLGISIIFQELSQVPQLTVAQNIFLGDEPRGILGVLNERAMIQRAAALLEEYHIGLNPVALLGRLSAAERQLAEIAKAVSLGSKILIMDEPTSALTIDETDNLFRIITILQAREVGIVYISHRMNEISQVADRITVLRDGNNVGMFGVTEVTTDEVVRLMVGRELEAVNSAHRSPEAERISAGQAPALELRGLSRDGVLRDVSFTLKPGEILGLAGLVGSGRSEVARAIFGIDRFDAGEILIDGKDVLIRHPGDAMAAGVALLPEDRRQQGLFLQLTVERNVVLPILQDLSRAGVVNAPACRRTTVDFIERLNIRPPDPTRVVQFLSGGNQQKVVLSKWLASGPKVFIMDEPTAGIDVGSKAEIHLLMRNLADGGVGILLISSDMPEIINVSDRVLVMHDGMILGEFSHEEVTQEKIMSKIMDSVVDKGGTVNGQ